MYRSRFQSENPDCAGDDVQHHEDEHGHREIDAQHQPAERGQRAKPEIPDGVGHGAERTDGRDAHHDGDNLEEHHLEILETADHRLGGLAKGGHGHAEQDREEHDLEDLSLRKCAHDARRDDVHQEVDHRELRSGGVLRYVARGEPGRVDAAARLHEIYHDQPDPEGERGDNLEIDECLETDPSNALEIVGPGNAEHDGEKDDRRDHHLHEVDERLTDGPHRLRRRWCDDTKQRAAGNGKQHLDGQVTTELSMHGDGGRLHGGNCKSKMAGTATAKRRNCNHGGAAVLRSLFPPF